MTTTIIFGSIYILSVIVIFLFIWLDRDFQGRVESYVFENGFLETCGMIFCPGLNTWVAGSMVSMWFTKLFK